MIPSQKTDRSYDLMNIVGQQALMRLFSIAPIYSEKLYMATTFKVLIPDGTKAIHQVPWDDNQKSVEKMSIRGSLTNSEPYWQYTSKILNKKNHNRATRN